MVPHRQGTLTQIRDALVAASALPKLYVSVSLPEGIFEAAEAQKAWAAGGSGPLGRWAW